MLSQASLVLYNSGIFNPGRKEMSDRYPWILMSNGPFPLHLPYNYHKIGCSPGQIKLF